MNVKDIDDALVASYMACQIPADRYFGNAQLTQAFMDEVRVRAGNRMLKETEVMQRLLTLRKTGRLPRLQRDYHGRNVN